MEWICIWKVQNLSSFSVHRSSSSCLYSSPETLSSISGYLGSPQPDITGPKQCTWVIKVQKGQRVNITLFDFSVSQGRRDDSGICLVYAIIQEHEGGTHINVCRGIHRERNVYISETNEVQVQVFSDPETADAGYFLLKYDGKILTVDIACPDLLNTRKMTHSILYVTRHYCSWIFTYRDLIIFVYWSHFSSRTIFCWWCP